MSIFEKQLHTLAAIFALLVAIVPAAANAGPLATVSSVTITEEDVALRQRVAPVTDKARSAPEQLRLATLRQLLIEAAGANAAAFALRGSADLRREADMQSRQLLLSLYDSSRTSRVSVSSSEIDAFIVGHPQFFSGRRTWHFHEASIRAKQPDRIRAMNSAVAAVVGQVAVLPEDVPRALAWSQGEGFDTVLANRWLGTEQIAVKTFEQLRGMAASGREVHADCSEDTCRLLFLHGSYEDRVDPQFLRESVRRNLLAEKQAALAETVNAALLARTPIVFHDAAVAREATKAWSRPRVLAAPAGLRLLWVMQALTLFAALGWAARQILGRQLRSTFEVKRPRWGLGMDDATIALLRGRSVELALAAGLSVITLASAIRVFALTSFVDYTQDMVMIAGFVALGIVLIVVPYRMSSACRRVMERRIEPIATIAVVQSLVLLATG